MDVQPMGYRMSFPGSGVVRASTDFFDNPCVDQEHPYRIGTRYRRIQEQ